MKVASYNVNGVNGRLSRLLEWLGETSPDVVCLQELKTDDSKFPIRAIESAGYGAIWHGQRSHHGVAILAKGETPVELRRGLPCDSTGQKILANDSTSADKKSSFFLVVHTDQAVAELMAECPKYGAMATFSLELVWRLRMVTCFA